jgi:DNA-directed RNA polymerase subunit RPC12/RpoP
MRKRAARGALAVRSEETTFDDSGFLFDATRKTYTVIDNWLFEEALTKHEKLVYIVLKRYAINPARIFPSHSTIARAASISVRTVIRALSGLTEKKLVLMQSNKGVGRSNIYVLFDPPGGNGGGGSGAANTIEDGMSGRHTPMPDSHTGMTKGQTGYASVADYNYVVKLHSKNTTTFLCFLCGKEFEEPAIQRDILRREVEACPKCASVFFLSPSEIPLSKKALLQLLRSHDPEKVFMTIDIINFQYNGKGIENYQRLLMGLLKKEIIVPEGYVPHTLRRIEERERKIKAGEKEALKREMELHDSRYRKEAERRLKALSNKERKKVEALAKEGLPDFLRKSKVSVRFAVYKQLMGKEDDE